MKKVLIAIHGLGNKPSEELLSRWWLEAIREGLNRIGRNRENIPFEMVYWADIFYPKPLDPDIRDKKDPLFLDEYYTPCDFTIKDKTSTLKAIFFRYIEDQLDKVFLNEDYSLNYSDVTDKILQFYFFELETYFMKEEIPAGQQGRSAKEELRSRLYRTLNRYKGYQILLISHSMGSIVSFDVLSNFSNKLNIHTFVTMGSPLGLPIVVQRIFSEQRLADQRLKSLQVPDCICPYWYNLSDPEDKVALDHTLADDFMQNRNGVDAVDLPVHNDFKWNGRENPHKSYGYLRTIQMAAIIDAFFTGRPREDLLQKITSFPFNQLEN